MEEKNSERQEERWWGYYDGGVREEVDLFELLSIDVLNFYCLSKIV